MSMQFWMMKPQWGYQDEDFAYVGESWEENEIPYDEGDPVFFPSNASEAFARSLHKLLLAGN